MTASDARTDLQRILDSTLLDADRWTKLWSLTHHGFMFGAAIFSGLAALVLQIKSLPIGVDARTDIGSGLAFLATIIGTISASGGFARKWRANRVAKGALERLSIDFSDSTCHLPDIRARLKAINEQRNEEIVGGLDATVRSPAVNTALAEPSPAGRIQTDTPLT